MLVAMVATALIVALVFLVARAVRRRIRVRMAGIDGRLDDLQRQLASLERLETLRVQLQYTEAVLRRGEDEGSLSETVAAEMRRYLQHLSEDLGQVRQ